MRGRSIGGVIIAACIAGLAGLGALLFSDGCDPARIEGERVQGMVFPAGPAVRDVENGTVLDAAVATNRIGVRSQILVADEHGNPIKQAESSWTRIGSAVPSWATEWPFDDGSGWRANTTLCASDSDGVIELEPPPGDVGSASAMWITHPGHGTWSMLLGSDGELARISDRITLSTAPVIELSVEDVDGRFVSGATVVQRLPLSARMRNDLGDDGVRLAYGLRRESRTDMLGRTLLASLDRTQIVDATLGTLRSGSWTGTAPDTVHLRWGQDFTWFGHVEAEHAGIDLSNSRVELRAVVGGRATWLGVAAVRSDGSFGPCTSPRMICDVLEFELEGSTFVPTVALRAAPLAGEALEVVLAARGGFRYPVTVTDREGQALSSAEVSWSWAVGETWKWASRMTNEAGLAVLPAAPGGSLWLMAEKRGYIPAKIQMEVWSDVSPSYPLVLDRGGVLRGTVTSSGSPVTDFSIVHRSVSGFADLTTVDFPDRKDGTFVIEGVPLGPRLVFAVGEFMPRSAAQSVDLDAAVSTNLSFELWLGRSISGTVRDALTGEPIEKCGIRNWITDIRTLIRPFGASASTDALGRFQLDGLSVGELNTIEFAHPNYAPSFLVARGDPDGARALNAVSLSPKQLLRVILRLPDGHDPRAWKATLWAGGNPRSAAFLGDGVIEFEGLAAASYDVEISRGIDRNDLKSILLRSDTSNTLIFDLTRGVTFVVEIDPGDDSTDLSECHLRIHTGSNGRDDGHVRSLPIPASRRVVVEGVEGSPADLRVVTRSLHTLGAVRVRPEHVADQTVQLRLGKTAREVQVLNRAGEPLASVLTGLVPRNGGWRFTYATNSDGIVRFEGVDDEVADLHLHRSGGGGGVIREVMFGDEPVSVTYADDGHLALRVHDGATPLSGVAVWLWDGFGLDLGFEPLVTDIAGRAERLGFLVQGFEAEVQQPGLWPTRQRIQAREQPVEEVIQVRRRGSVILRAKRGGLALAGVTIRVESEEFATSVDPWIADGRVKSSEAQCRTDSHGSLRLDGLPRGPYRWSTALEDGTTVGGRFEVEPQRRVDVDVLVP